MWASAGAVDVLGGVEVTVWVQEQRTQVRPFGASDLRCCYTSDRVSIQTLEGDSVEEASDMRNSFVSGTPWTAMQVAHVTGYTMWTYLSEPQHLTMPGVQVVEDGGQSWRRLQVRYPADVVTHGAVQTIYVDDEGLIRRRDFNIDVLGVMPAVEYAADFREDGGVLVPATRRTFVLDDARQVLLDRPLLSVELADIRVA